MSKLRNISYLFFYQTLMDIKLLQIQIQIRLLPTCRGELSGVISQLMSKVPVKRVEAVVWS